MLTGMEYDTFNSFGQLLPGVQVGDEIIFRQNSGTSSDIESYSYGIITAHGIHFGYGLAYVVAPAQFYGYQFAGSCALLLLPQDLILKPEFGMSDHIPIPPLESASQDPSMWVIIKERKVALRADGKPVYRYCYWTGASGDDETSSDLEDEDDEEDLIRFIDATTPNDSQDAARVDNHDVVLVLR